MWEDERFGGCPELQNFPRTLHRQDQRDERVSGKPGEPEDIGMTHVLQDAGDHQGNDVVAEQYLGSCLPPPECAQEGNNSNTFANGSSAETSTISGWLRTDAISFEVSAEAKRTSVIGGMNRAPT